MTSPRRTLVVGCTDWPLTAAGVAPGEPVAVLNAHRVQAASAAARAAGVQRGQRQREAQACCPDLGLIQSNPDVDARAFEPVVAAVAAFSPRVEIIRPGVVALATRGPSRYFGGDAALATRITATVCDTLTGIAPADQREDRCRVGIADGLFAALLAASRRVVVPPGRSTAFLAPFAITTLDRPELTGLLRRLGITTLGALAALDERAVLDRFGTDGLGAHRLARGLDERPLAPRPPRAELTVAHPFDPPAERIDMVAFAARGLAEQLHQSLQQYGLVCVQLAIEAETAHDEQQVRLWRHLDGAFTPDAMVDRLRWQLGGWWQCGDPPSAGVSMIRLHADECAPVGEVQPDLWDASATIDAQVRRTLSRVQGLLGQDRVTTAVIGGGRTPTDQLRLVAWGDPREPARPGLPGTVTVRVPTGVEMPPWPGRLPPPTPAIVHVTPL
ncbi:MAG: DNA polymerase Y family protein, partial [Actinobacteria bacterium]|nr:DNA polymerase Y family protein [Actinomycetota bacterium]